MGVPALFRWLSKKYPKIVLPVVEEEEQSVEDENGVDITLPIDFNGPNPNGVEFDNLYLDMNGIVHPCTHPEGKPAPETEEEMMVEIFAYTERVVDMVRPRKLLLMAIDGVAPRAKMNQQRSRRFRSAQEAKEKEEAHKESLQLWESMGQTVTEEMKTKKSWDSNAITPGTPFMDLLAQSLRYWVVRKMNTDPGWKNLEVIISDASVPGEGEHKIMDYIRRQRTNPGHDPNTRHVIYGLDADLIMLSLATHEPNFRVLREDVFFQDVSPTACRTCGQEGHFAAQCTGAAKEKADEHDTKKKTPVKKPFIFLDVNILREYLEIELNVPSVPFTFDFERALDDWVLLIFFVGNDFLPHLPSLEIREGAIDTLLKIWKDELPRMGGYLTNHGLLEYARVEIILEGLASRETDIFRRRREAEQRSEQNAKRRKLESEARKNPPTINTASQPGPNAQQPVSAVSASPSRTIHALPPKPNFDSFESAANSLGFGASTSPPSPSHAKSEALAAIQGDNNEWLAKRREIRMANLSAAEMLKAEMMSAVPVSAKVRQEEYERQREAAIREASLQAQAFLDQVSKSAVDADVPMAVSPTTIVNGDPNQPAPESNQLNEPELKLAEGAPDALQNAETGPMQLGSPLGSPRGAKRKIEEIESDGGVATEESTVVEDDEEEAAGNGAGVLTRKVNADGSVEQDDFVKLWEPGYQERYYRQKFGVESSDVAFKKKITTHYVEGMAWVLQYYYQGTPSWTWYYPFHFAPFAADFSELDKMDIKFDIGQPFKPFEQLMGVFPAASRAHIPEVFHHLMTSKDSPIVDFYPEDFQVDMNGKKMAWQGVTLLPFIDETRLLEAMADGYTKLDDEQLKRNKWGNSVLYVADEHPLYPQVESLYAKRKDNNPIPIDPQLSKGMSGTILPDPDCLPGSTYESPLTSEGLPDISGDRSLAALYFFPKQLRPHHSVLLPGLKRAPRILTQEDVENISRRGQPRGRGGREGFHSVHNNYSRDNSNSRGSYGHGGRGGFYGNTNGREGYERSGMNNSNGGGGGGYGGYGNAGGRYGNGPPSQAPRAGGGGGGGGGGSGGYGYDNRNSNSNYGYGQPARSYAPPPSKREPYGGGGGGGGYRGNGGTGQYGSHGRNPPAQGGYGGQESRGYGGYGASSGGGYGGYGQSGGGGGYGQSSRGRGSYSNNNYGRGYTR